MYITTATCSVFSIGHHQEIHYIKHKYLYCKMLIASWQNLHKKYLII
jgi:hypothetical protein